MGREIQTRQGFGVEVFRSNFLKIIYYYIVSFLSGPTYQPSRKSGTDQTVK
jgi:hypothetical protein